jgi:alkanesulfonate monooxygenase SsuD/methylene tetrahydromethanopterin reductase-like flavin-dependent oxidoreductase (luciferase family)
MTERVALLAFWKGYALYRDKATRARAYEAVSHAMLESLMVTGDPAECRDRMQRLSALGIDLPILMLPNNAEWPAIEGYLRAMAPRER